MVNMDNPTTSNEAATVARALADQAERVIVALWGEPDSRSRREIRWGNHGSRSACLAGEKRGLWIDFERGEGGDLLDLIAHERGVSLREAIEIARRDFLGEFALAPVSRRPFVPKVPRDDEKARLAAAHRIWREATAMHGTLGERYFHEHRKLEVARVDIGHALRWHAGIRAVVALMTDAVSGTPLGIHRTFLDPDGAKRDRKMLGPQGVIRLSPDEAVMTGLGIAEGIEDAIAILLSGWQPVWAATCAGAIAKFPILEIQALTIFADADLAGMRAAEVCRDTWLAAGREVAIASPRRSA